MKYNIKSLWNIALILICIFSLTGIKLSAQTGKTLKETFKEASKKPAKQLQPTKRIESNNNKSTNRQLDNKVKTGNSTAKTNSVDNTKIKTDSPQVGNTSTSLKRAQPPTPKQTKGNNQNRTNDYERIYKDKNQNNELKVRRKVSTGEIRYDRVSRSGKVHDHEFVKINQSAGKVIEGGTKRQPTKSSTVAEINKPRTTQKQEALNKIEADNKIKKNEQNKIESSIDTKPVTVKNNNVINQKKSQAKASHNQQKANEKKQFEQKQLDNNKLKDRRNTDQERAEGKISKNKKVSDKKTFERKQQEAKLYNDKKAFEENKIQEQKMSDRARLKKKFEEENLKDKKKSVEKRRIQNKKKKDS